MQGLELAERYFEEHGRPLLAGRFESYQDRIAAGLVGEGSECYGFDDELSRDHDWGPGFCLWLTAADYREFGAELQITDFYRRFIRYDHVPATPAEWRSLPETYLATATNGKVFTDPLGEFTAFRQGLLAFYPEDVRLKKLAARCASAGQTGQYNYARCVARGELVAAHCALSSFTEAVSSIVYLLNKRYRPFYKWMHRGMKGLPVLGEPCYRLLADLCAEGDGPTAAGVFSRRQRIVEEISALIVAHLTVEGLSDSESDFLLDHAHAVQARIEDQVLRSLHVMME
jgi:hypothetical protein